MKNTIIFVLLLIIVWLAWNKRPVIHQHQKDHVIERLTTITDTFKVEVMKYKQKVELVHDTIEVLKLDVQIAKENNDTLLIIQKQDTLINTLEVQVNYYSNLVDVCDSVITNQNKVIELKDGIIFEQKKVIKNQNKKQKKHRFFTIVGTAILGTFLILK